MPEGAHTVLASQARCIDLEVLAPGAESVFKKAIFVFFCFLISLDVFDNLTTMTIETSIHTYI